MRDLDYKTLLDISRAVAAVRDAADLPLVVMGRIQPLLGFHDAGIYVADGEGAYHRDLTAKMHDTAPCDAGKSLRAAGLDLKMPHRVREIEDCIKRCQAAQSPIIFDLDVTFAGFDSHPSREVTERAGCAEGMATLLKARGETIGLFLLNSLEKGFFTPAQFPLFEAVADQVAVAVANILANEEVARLAEERRVRAAELARTNEALQRSMRRLASEATPDNFVAQFHRELRELLGCRATAHFRVDWEARRVKSGTIVDDEQTASEELQRLAGIELKCFPAWQTDLAEDRVLVLDPVRDAARMYPQTAEFMRERGLTWLVSLPLYVRGRPAWIIAALGRDESHLTEHNFELLKSLSGPLTLALEMCELGDEAGRGATLSEANDLLLRRADVKSLTDAESLDRFLGSILLTITKQLGANSSTVWLNDNEKRISHLKFIVENGALIPAAQAVHPNRRAPASLAAEIQEAPFPPSDRPEPQMTSLGDTEFAPALKKHLQPCGANYLLCVPMVLGGEHLGSFVVRFEEERTYPQKDLHLAQALVNQATLAVRLTRLADEAKQTATAKERERAAQERAEQLTKANDALERTVGKLAEQSQLDVFLGHVLIEISAATNSRSASVFVHDAEADTLTLRAFVHQGQVVDIAGDERMKLWRQPVILNPETRPRWDNIRRRSHIHSASGHETPDDPQSWKFAQEFHRMMGHNTTIAVPLRAGKKELGFLGVNFTAPPHIAEQQLSLTQTLAHQVALALQLDGLADRATREAEQAAVLEERNRLTEERTAELTRFNEALQSEVRERERAETVAREQTEAIKMTLDLLATEKDLSRFFEQMMRNVVDQLSPRHSIRAASVWLYDAHADTLRLDKMLVDNEILSGDTLSELGMPPGDYTFAGFTAHPLWNDFIRAGESFTMDDEALGAFGFEGWRRWASDHAIKVFLVAPMWRGDEFVGTLTVYSASPDGFTAEETELVNALAQQTNLALQLSDLDTQSRQTAALKERTRIAGDIHDTLAQSFTGIVVQLQAAERALKKDPAESAGHLGTAIGLAREGLAEARRSVQALRPRALDDAGFVDALRRLLAQMTDGSLVKGDFRLSGEPFALTENVSVCLMRICQEAITNAVRHASARKIAVELAFGVGTEIHLTVTDDGKGFDSADVLRNGKGDVDNNGLGLPGIRTRAAEIGAALEVESAPGAGTRIIVTARA